MTANMNIQQTMLTLGEEARSASKTLAIASTDQKRLALNKAAEALRTDKAHILEANKKDLAAATTRGLQASFMDRLTLTEERINAIADALIAVANLNDPVGEVIAKWDRPNGLDIERVRTPLGVIGVIFESRPNVTADAGALCLMAGNAVILRGGSDSYHSSRAIHTCLMQGLKEASLPQAAIQLVPTTDRAAVGEMLTGLNGCIDVIIPRGGKSLVARVQTDARVPVFAHLEGLCHLYIDKDADLKMAIEIAVNAKMRRTGICGSAETLLIDKAVIETHLAPICNALIEADCALRGDETVCHHITAATPASEEDWHTEYLDAILSVKVVDGIDGALDHINTYSSNHTDALVTKNASVAERFFNEIDSAILLHNASTQFADGGEFGMGAEIGIATGKMHARGPVGVEQLTSFKYRVRGTGQVRPT